jgi:peptidoglycan/LPS O-acetylase OafA/YrhL
MDGHQCEQALERILMFDLIRITAMLMVVVQHTAGIFNLNWLTATYGPLGKISAITGLGGNLGNIGVELFIILSGCVIEYRYGKQLRDGLSSFTYKGFIAKRIAHLYPAYWLSLILAIILFPKNLAISITEILKTITGFWIFQTFGSGVPDISQPINIMGWFIGLMIVLYLMWPMLSYVISDYKYGFATIILASVATRIIILTLFPYGNEWYWFPLSRMAEFALGIWLVQEGWYWKATTTNRVIAYLSDLSFPVFLVHYLLLGFLTINLALYVVVVIATSATIMHLNNGIGDWIMKKESGVTT